MYIIRNWREIHVFFNLTLEEGGVEKVRGEGNRAGRQSRPSNSPSSKKGISILTSTKNLGNQQIFLIIHNTRYLFFSTLPWCIRFQDGTFTRRPVSATTKQLRYFQFCITSSSLISPLRDASLKFVTFAIVREYDQEEKGGRESESTHCEFSPFSKKNKSTSRIADILCLVTSFLAVGRRWELEGRSYRFPLRERKGGGGEGELPWRGGYELEFLPQPSQILRLYLKTYGRVKWRRNFSNRPLFVIITAITPSSPYSSFWSLSPLSSLSVPHTAEDTSTNYQTLRRNLTTEREIIYTPAGVWV